MKKEIAITTLLSLSIFVLLYLISGRLWFRLDMTENKAFTLSMQTRNLHREIDDSVSITYFVSERLTASFPVVNDIEDTLREIAAHSNGSIHFIKKDPLEGNLERTVENLGIFPWQIQVVERNQIVHATVYSGILLEYLDREEVIPLVVSMDTLEFDINFRIRTLTNNSNRVIGIVLADLNMDMQIDFSLLNHALVLSGFIPFQINPAVWIPPYLPALFVLGGEEYLAEESLRHIDEYIMSGGNVFFAINGVSVDVWGNLYAFPVYDLGILPMLANYGVIVERAIVLDRASLFLSYQTQGAGGTQVQSISYPPWIAVEDKGVNQDHVLSASSLGPDFFWPSPLTLLPTQGISTTALYISSTEAWLQREEFITNPNWVSQFENERISTLGTKILCAALTGSFPSAFSEELLFSDRTSRILVAGDLNFLGPLMQTTQSEDRNLEFPVRAALWLTGEEDLIPLRGRDPRQGRLDRISDPALRDSLMAFSRNLNTFIIPIILAIISILVCLRRNK